MRVAVTGASGMVGTALVEHLRAEGHEVRRVSRRLPTQLSDIQWDPAEGRLARADLADLDAVVHLAGANIGTLWTAKNRDRIYRSRIDGTNLLVAALAGARSAPVLVTASAIGYYGDRGDEELTEESQPGVGFLARLCQDWEAAAARATEHGCRVVQTRFGVIQARDAGMLVAMRRSALVGPVVRFGHGRRHQSWVALDDVTRAITFALATPALAGPLNVTSPNPITNAAYAATLGRIMRRPVIAVPPLLPRIALPGVADELLLQSAKVLPGRLLSAGFQFRYPTLDSCLRALL